MAQRLVRLICPRCRALLPEADAQVLIDRYNGNLPKELYVGKGCRACNGTGYQGRRGVFEMMPMTEQLRALATGTASARQVRRTAVEEGMHSLREDGWRLVREGLTTVQEVLRGDQGRIARVRRNERSGLTMPVYTYIGLEPNGRKRSGVIDAASSAAAAEAVEQRGLMPVSMDEQVEHQTVGLKRAATRVRPSRVHQFLRQLAGLLTAGVPLSRALEILGRESTSAAAKGLQAAGAGRGLRRYAVGRSDEPSTRASSRRCMWR